MIFCCYVTCTVLVVIGKQLCNMAKNSNGVYGLWLALLLCFAALMKGHALHATGYVIPSKKLLIGRSTLIGMALGSSVGVALCDSALGASAGACLGGLTGLAVGEGIAYLSSSNDNVRVYRTSTQKWRPCHAWGSVWICTEAKESVDDGAILCKVQV